MGFLLLAGQKRGGGQYLRRANMFGPEVPIDPSTYYTPGNGDPAVSTADYYFSSGFYWGRCYDLLTMGTAGAAIAAANARYAWVFCSDHAVVNVAWADEIDMRVGFSSDPGILPATGTRGIREQYPALDILGQTNYYTYQAYYLVYNPDDAVTPFWMYGEGLATNRSHEEGLSKSSDLINWTPFGPTHRTDTLLSISSFQRVVRVGTGDWYSHGLATLNDNDGGLGVWTSTDGEVFTQQSHRTTNVVGNSIINFAAFTPIDIGGTLYDLVKEEVYNIPPYSPPQTYVGGPHAAGSRRIAQYVALFPIDTDFNYLATPPVIRISDAYEGVYPGPSYLQNPSGYVEDGVLHVYALNGFPMGTEGLGLISGAAYARGGGLWEQNVDYYTYIVDATAAAAAAPVGVTASCDAGVVTVSWYDALPNRTYRVYKGSSAGTQATLVGDVTGINLSITDTPTPGQQWWYKVVTLQSGTERQNRVVHCYVSANSELANRHVNRVIDDGGDDTTINQTWLEACIQWAISNGLNKCIEFWADAAFGVKLSAGKVVKVYCLGTTILPRGGDLTMQATNTTYSATGLNSTAPAWTNPNGSDHAYWGGQRINNIRRKVQCTFFAAYKKPGTVKASFIGSDDGGVPGLGLEHVAGTPGSASFYIEDATQTITATAALASATGVNVILGIFDGTNVTCYGNGTAGTPQAGLDPNLLLANAHSLKGLATEATSPPFPVVVSGCSNTTYNYTDGRTYFRNEALFTASCIGMFSKGMTAAQAISFDSLQATHIGR